jgi:hypothetical protein
MATMSRKKPVAKPELYRNPSRKIAVVDGQEVVVTLTGKPIRKNETPRRTAYGEAITKIYTKFVKPLADVHTADTTMALLDGIKRVFNWSDREVWFAEVAIAFKMPGKKWKGGRHDRLIGGTGQRKIKVGHRFIVRWDKIMWNRCEMEDAESGEVYVLTHAQFEVVKEKLRFIC